MAQLRMRRPNLENLPPVKPPEGYGIRHYQPGDEIHWGAIIDASFGGQRTEEDVRREITERPVFTPEGLFFATYQGQPVGTACSWKGSPDETKMGYVHMVGVMPGHQGHGLGYLVSLATLHFFKEHGFQEAMLDTDDQRIPALITYLRLGFEPVLRDDGQRHRWALIFSKFLESGPTDIHPAIRRYFTQLELIDDLSIENYQGFFETVCNLSLEDYRRVGVAGNPAPSELRRLDDDLEEKIKTIPIRKPLEIMLKERIDQYFVGESFRHIYLLSREDFSSRQPYELLKGYCQKNDLPILECDGDDLLKKSIALSDAPKIVLFCEDLSDEIIGTKFVQRNDILLIARESNPERDISGINTMFQIIDIENDYPLSQEQIYQILNSYLEGIRIQTEIPISEAHLRKISNKTKSPGDALNHLGICLAFSAYRRKIGKFPKITDDDLQCCCNRRVISWIDY